IIEISPDSSEDRKRASKATAPIFYGPLTQELLDTCGYNTIEEYLSWNYFPSTDNESTDMETTDKRNTDKYCIVDSKLLPMSSKIGNIAMLQIDIMHIAFVPLHFGRLHVQEAFANIAIAHCNLAGLKFMIIAGAENRPPMLEKSMYDSWKSHMELYMENKENGRMILDSDQNGPLVWPTIIEENGTTRKKNYEELSVTKKLQ
ncbi:hypothetical protein Tco_0179999, partial [Tanacetum coccineum]